MRSLRGIRFARFVAFGPVAAMLLLAGCTADGGGTLTSACGFTTTRPATFGFSYVAPDATSVGGLSGTYRDPCMGIALRGEGRSLAPVTTSIGPVIPGCVGTFLLGSQIDYVSLNPARAGSGQAHVFVCDLTPTGPGDGDFMLITIDTGPLAPYVNIGFVQHGNIVVLQDN